MLAYNIIEPSVIDEDLLQTCVSDQASGDAADIARKEGIDLADVLSLRLDYKNILRIEHLWQLTSLTKLQLDNNIIEKISGLDHLINLRWLDLSFNNISVIEGLESLVNLTDLSLFNNRISILEGLDQCINLDVISIGNNNITDIQQLAYLSKFKNLRLLNVAGNPLCKSGQYRQFILSRINHLKYLDYRLVDPKSVQAARDMYIDKLIAIEEEQKIVHKQMAEHQLEKQQQEMYTAAFIPDIDHLLSRMFDSDTDFNIILPLARETLLETQAQFKDNATVVINDLIATVLDQHDTRAGEVLQLSMCVAQTLKSSDFQSAKCFNEFMHEKKLILRNSASTRPSQLNVELIKSKLDAFTNTLLQHELVLVEQFEDLFKEFDRNFTDLGGLAKESMASAFTQLRELITQYQENVNTTVSSSIDRLSKSTDIDELDDTVRDLIRDKDTVANRLTGSHDRHLATIDNQEEAFTCGLAKMIDSVLSQLHQFETDRNRNRLSEIVIFKDHIIQELELAEENT